MRRIGKEEFYLRCSDVQKSKYDYSLVDYKNNRTNITIICPNHGKFEQLPSVHLRGNGCPKCSGNYKHTNEEFIDRIKLIFGDKIKYHLVRYYGLKNKVKIECPIHGVMEKFPQSLLRGSGCNICETKNYKINTKIFIERSINIHGCKYNYSKSIYINDSTPLDIICSKHGVFTQVPNIHLSGHGCIFCSGRYRYTNDQFIEKANLIHANKFDYSLVDYKNAHKKIEIVCKIHGTFEQKPNAHLMGNGCPSCKESKGEMEILKFLTEKNILFERQKTFNECRYKSLLFFDFFIPSKNLCIEYDGEFHFRPIFGEKLFQSMVIRDSIKNKFCIDNNIELLRISYRNINDIDKILLNKLI